MDLIFTDENRIDQGVLSHFSLDFEVSSKAEGNTFEVQGALGTLPVILNGYIHTEENEIGGRVDTVKVDTGKKVIYFSGRNFRGMLGSKVIEPPEGQAHKVVSGDVNDIIASLISDAGLLDLFVAENPCGVAVSKYQFDRYTDLYSGIVKMLLKVGMKLKLEWTKGRVKLGAAPIVDHSNDSELTSDLFDFVIEKNTAAVNHVIGLGQGELTERQVVHRYIGADGKVTDTQYYFGLDEVTEAISNTDCESYADLVERTETQLKKRGESDSLDITSYDLEADVGDKFSAYDVNTKLTVSQFVTTKIITFDGVDKKTKYEVGGSL